MLETPILFLVFNRPQHTHKVFKKIRAAKPKILFIAADGPRENIEGESKLCALTRKVAESVDWDCEVKTLFRENNLGCGKAVSEAISWFFQHVDAGIILEDDTVPSKSFFSYCEKMLTKYEEDKEVMHIGGNNFQFGRKVGNGDYYFSKFAHVWGWATWRRAWKEYSFDIADWSTTKIETAFSVLSDDIQRKHWEASWSGVSSGNIDTWDYQWQLTIWICKGKCIIPNRNLIQNIGFGEGATHTIYRNTTLESLKAHNIKYLKEPTTSEVNGIADDDYFSYIYLDKSPPLSRVEYLNRIILNFYKRISRIIA